MVEWKKLGDICEIKGRIGFRGYTRDDQVDKGKGAISLSPGNIDNGSMNYESCTYITWDKYEESPEIIVNEGDIILCKTASVGKVARIRHLPEKATINPQLVLIKNIQSNPQYLFYVLDDKPFQSKIKGLAGIGSVPNVSQAKLSAIEIPIPSLFEQNRIVGILDTFTSAIDNLKEQIAQRRKQYEYYRDQLLDLEGKEVIETLSFGNDFQLKARIGWQGLTKKEYKSSGDYKLVTGTDFTGNLRIDFASCVFVEKERYEQDEYIKLKVGDVLITKDGTLGKVAYIDQLDMPATLNGGVFVVRDPKRKVLPKFIMYYLTSYHFKKWMQQNHTTGSIQHLTQKLLSSFTIPVLPEAEQQRIVSILDTFEASIQNLEAQLEQRRKQYEYYRNKLLTFE